MKGKLTLTIEIDLEKVHPVAFIDAINEAIHQVAQFENINDEDNSDELQWAWEGDGVE